MKFVHYILGPFVGGLLFAIGLAMGGMTEASNIIGFLDVFGDWSPLLLFVMMGAVTTYAVLYRLILKKNKPLFENFFSLPSKKDIDKKLIIGAAIFGFGWGITGLCPGPGIVVLATGKPYAIYFALSMLLGMRLAQTNTIKKLF